MSDKVFQAIAELIAERNDSDPAEVTRNTRFQDVGIDSLDTVEMLMNLEDKIGDGEALNFLLSLQKAGR